MTQKKVKANAFKFARKCGFSYYWAQQYAKVKLGKCVVWDWKQFQLDNPDFVVSYDCDFDQVSGDFRNIVKAVNSKCVFEDDDFYGYCLAYFGE